MLDLPLMVWVKLLVVDRIYSQTNKCFMAVKSKVTGDSDLYSSNNMTIKLEKKKQLNQTLETWQILPVKATFHLVA